MNRAVPRLPDDPVRRCAVDPRLQIDEVGVVAAELAARPAERVDHRIARVLGLQSEVVGLTEVLRQVAKRVGALQGIRRRGVLEREISGGPETVAEFVPGRAQCLVVLAVAEGHQCLVSSTMVMACFP